MHEPEHPKADVSYLSTVNADFLGGLLGEDFLRAARASELTLEDALSANEALSEQLYGTEVASLVKNGNFEDIIKYRDEVASEIALEANLVTQINLDDYGLIVVRPELYSEAGQCISVLEEAGFNIAVDRDVVVDFHQYLSLYPHGLAIPETYYDFPTRTLNYIDKPSRLVVFKKGLNAQDNREASTIVSEDLKGMQGVYRKGTLRGQIAFRALEPYLDSSDHLASNALALDPIGVYRRLVAGEIPSNGIHNNVTHPLMFYAAQGVHVPDRTEIARDLSLLCNVQDIERIIDIEHTT